MEEEKLPKRGIIHELEPKVRKKRKISNMMTKSILITVVVMLLLGIGTGYIASNLSAPKKGPVSIDGDIESGDIKKGKAIGVDDAKQFPDTAEGVLRAGGIDGEGEYYLQRPGGESQNVYMTSSVVDLSQFVGKKLKVWGQTQTAQKAGWLMDVGKIELQ